jgi:hypothetical protein
MRAIAGDWIMELPAWLTILVHGDPVSCQLDCLRRVAREVSRLPMAVKWRASNALAVVARVLAARAMRRLRRA